MRELNNKLNKLYKLYKLNKLKGFSLLELVIVLVISSIILTGLVIMLSEFMRTHRRQERVTLIERSLEASQIALKDNLFSLPGRGLATSNGTLYEIPNLPSAGSIHDGVKNIPIRLGIITPYKVNENDAFTIIYNDAKIPRLALDPSGITQIGTTKTVRVPLPKGEPGYEPNPSNSDPTTLTIPNVEMFNIGQLMLLVDTPSFSSSTDTTSTQTKPTFATLVKLARVNKTSIHGREFLEFTLDVCQNGSCGQLVNDPLATTNISAGSILVPVKFTSFYLKKDKFGNKLTRNDDGLILPINDGNEFNVTGGNEIIVGESDSLNIAYRLRDGSVVTTPNTPIVPWLKDVMSVDVTLKSGMASNQGSEYLSRTRKINFPILSENLE